MPTEKKIIYGYLDEELSERVNKYLRSLPVRASRSSFVTSAIEYFLGQHE